MNELWSIVLAAGEGQRLREIAVDPQGRVVPKQFCSLAGGSSLLRQTRERVERVVAPERVVTVVAAQHRRWWARELGTDASERVVVQPGNRGTAPGILLPLLRVLALAPRAVVAVLPSDHYIGQEGVFLQALERAVAAVERLPETLVLLGIQPTVAAKDLGWILPVGSPEIGVRRVAAFAEKPDAAKAAALMRQGALWNSFVFVARGEQLLALFRRALPRLADLFEARLTTAEGWEDGELEELYSALPSADFSREVLERSAPALRVVAVPRCGWMDLGTPARVAECLKAQPQRRSARPAFDSPFPAVDLSRTLARNDWAPAPAVL